MDRLRRTAWAAGLLMVTLALLSAACNREEPIEQASPEEIAQLASEAVEALDEAVAVSAGQLEEAAEVVSEAVAVGELGLATPGTIVVGTNADFLPFVGFDDEEQLIGFDIELFNMVARRAGLAPRYVDMPFANLTGALTAGEVDVVIAALTITDERDEVIDFSRPYFAGSQSLGVPMGSPISGPEDLTADHAVAVLADTTGETYAVENFADAIITAYADRATAFAAVSSGDVQAVFMDTDAVVGQAREGALMLVEEVPTDERYAIGLPEGNAALRAALNTAIADVLQDGSYQTLFQEWFPARNVEQVLNLLR